MMRGSEQPDHVAVGAGGQHEQSRFVTGRRDLRGCRLIRADAVFSDELDRDHRTSTSDVPDNRVRFLQRLQLVEHHFADPRRAPEKTF